MSTKRVVKKKAEEVEKPTDTKSPKNSLPPAATASVNDVRVAQQMRVMEVVGANTGVEKDDKKYSPRTEGHIKSLQPVLDHYEYSRADIASLVKRCHNDDIQIQIAVANILEDRANHEADSWGEVKTKKQLKEAKKLKEEEEQREQERLEKELEKQRRDAEKRAQREERNRKNGKAGNSYGADPTSLPPDPAILFAGSKPVEYNNSGGNGDDWQWEENFSSNWAGDGDWNADGDWNKENGKDWEWHKGQWDEDEWEGKAGDDWWSGDWEKAGGGRGKRGAKEQRGRGDNAKKESKDAAADMWDMPDTAADPDKQAGLDQWTLGDIRAYDASHGTEDDSLGLPKVPPTSGMRTVEEIERQQFGTGSPPTAPPMGLPPGKSRIDSLFHQETNGLPPPKAPAEDGEGKGKGKEKGEKGEKGRGRGKGKSKDGGKEGEGKERTERPRRERESGDTDDGVEKLERIDRSDDPRRQAIEEVGEHVTVKKHSSMGCAVISLRDPRVREAILVMLGERTTVAGHTVQLKPHFEKDTKVEVVTDIFAAWGRQAEKNNPLPERELMKFFEGKHAEIAASWREEAEAKARADDQARQQQLLEEQQRALQEREDQRRAFEDQLRRQEAEKQVQVAESQRKALEEQARQSEHMRIQRESKAKYVNELQGNWAQSVGMLPGATSALDPRVAANLAGASNATALAAAQQQARESASASGLNPAATSYNTQAQAQQAWQTAQWMQAMYTQGAWQQQMAQQQMAQRASMQQAQQMGAHAQQDYENQIRTQAAYYAYLQDQAQRGHSAQSAQTAAAYQQQQQQQQQQQAYMGGQQQSGFAGYNAAAYGQQRGERI